MVDKNIIAIPDKAVIEDEASVWVVRCQDEALSPAQEQELRAWLSQSEQHRQAFNELAEFYGGLDFVEGLQDYAENDAVQPPLAQDKREFSRRGARRVLLGAIAATVVATVAGVTYLEMDSHTVRFDQTYSTNIGEQETVSLPDGSTILLNTGSEVAVSLTGKERLIRLAKGEAFFEVAKDPKRPFSVSTEKGVVTAVGTAFSVRLTEEKLDVVVTEGRVALEAIERALENGASQERLIARAREISAGQSAILNEGVEEISVVQPAELARAVDWQDGELSFRGDTLEAVIQDVSRYTDLRIEINGDDLKQERIVASYKVGDIDRLLEALVIVADVEIERFEDGRVTLTRSLQ